MVLYGLAVAAYLGNLAVSGLATGILCWPAIVAHLLLSVTLIWLWRKLR